MGLKTIFQEGLKEKRRRKSMRSGNNQLKDKRGLYVGLLTALGQKAWESHVAIDAFGELKTALSETKTVLDQMQARSAELGRQKQQAEHYFYHYEISLLSIEFIEHNNQS